MAIDLRRLTPDDLSREILSEEFDFCFMPRDMVPESSEIETVSTHTEPLVIVSCADANRQKGQRLSISSLGGRNLSLLSESVAPILYMEIVDLLRTFHVTPDSETAYDDISPLFIAVSSGMGFSIVPQSMAEFASGSRLKQYPISDADTGIAYVMTWTKSNTNSVAPLFIDMVKALASGEDNVYGI